MRRRALKLETRYAYLLRDAKVLTAMLEVAASKLTMAARQIEGTDDVYGLTPSDLREAASECARIAHRCGRVHRGAK